MARVESVSLVDDLDGGEADESVAFFLDGREFEIDLSSRHADELRDVLAPYITAARRASTGLGRRGQVRASSSPTDRERNQQIRAWAVDNGFTVSNRGRIPAEVLQAFADRESRPGPAEVVEKPSRRSRKTDGDAA